jgi:hypothetical protein
MANSISTRLLSRLDQFRGISAQRHFWTTLRLEEAAAAVEKRIPIIDQLARRGENLAGSLPD